ncbi:MAG: DUF2478 domain-containing protein [Deltaproteobacteria bacterium]|nr:DUF2478 domain-containing protein [Deltaproteobacteria bacterium]
MARWALISGEGGSDKSACARQVADRLQAAGLRVGGYLQHKLRDEQGQKRYELGRLGAKAERVVLAVDGIAAKGPGEDFFCSMAFYESAFDAARRWVEEDARAAEVLVLDGISKLEVSGKGHCAALESALRLPEDQVVILCARASQLSCVVERFALDDSAMVAALEVPAEAAAVEELASAVREAVGKPRTP